MGGTRLLNPKMDPYSTTSNQKNVTAECNFSFRKPVSTDGSDVFALVERCKPLDVNSMYCNLLQCSHFADTAIVAERGGQMVGFISGYRLPQQPDKEAGFKFKMIKTS